MSAVYVVATIKRPMVSGGNDFFADIILITPNEDEARTIKYTVQERRPYPSLDYNKLASFDDVIYFERELGSVIQNKDEG
jgi:hypothetical protein